MSVAIQLAKIKEKIKDYPNTKIIAATKYFDIEKTKEIIDAGIKDIGENRKDTFLAKYDAFKDKNLTWHFFGVIKIPPKLSTNFIDSIDYLHSLDSINLADAINKTRKKPEPLKCFVQVKPDSHSSGAGLSETKVIPFIKSLAKYEKIQVVGLMSISIMTYDEEIIEKSFQNLKELQKEVQALNLPYAPCTELSMGASNDYQIALRNGSTMIRIGTLLSK